MNKKVIGGFLTTLGFLLSPLSWWNDIFFNIPLAYAFGFLFSLISKSLFLPAMIFGYWLTNIFGLVLMHRGIKDLVSKGDPCHKVKKDFLKDLVISIVYTLVVIVLISFGWLKSPLEYF